MWMHCGGHRWRTSSATTGSADERACLDCNRSLRWTAKPYWEAYLRTHGWVQVLPLPSDTEISYFVRGTSLLDRIEVVNGRWSHMHFNGTAWLTNPEACGDDAAGLGDYLRKSFRSGRR
jgi:hypothetical protein